MQGSCKGWHGGLLLYSTGIVDRQFSLLQQSMTTLQLHLHTAVYFSLAMLSVLEDTMPQTFITKWFN